jgi:hypothetical protein
VQAVLKRSNKESWPFNEEKGRGRGGKRRLYPLSSLPADIRAALAEAPLVTEPAADIIREEPEPFPPVTVETLANWQRSCRDARLRILREIERMKRLEGVEKAMRHFIALAETGELCDSLAQAVEVANARKREGKALCTFTIRNWMKALAKGGPDALAPRGNPPKPMPVWLPDFLKLYRQPQKPNVSWCYEKVTGAGVALPSLRTVQREIKRLGVVEANRGRMGRRELKSLLAYSTGDRQIDGPAAEYGVVVSVPGQNPGADRGQASEVLRQPAPPGRGSLAVAAFTRPGDTPADVVDRLGCVVDWLAEAGPAWAARLEHEPPSDGAVAGLAILCQALAEALHELARADPAGPGR